MVLTIKIVLQVTIALTVQRNIHVKFRHTVNFGTERTAYLFN